MFDRSAGCALLEFLFVKFMAEPCDKDIYGTTECGQGQTENS